MKNQIENEFIIMKIDKLKKKVIIQMEKKIENEFIIMKIDKLNMKKII